MKNQVTILKGVLVAGLVLMTIFSSYAEGDKTKKITSHKLVVFVEQLNQLVNVVEEIELKIENWMVVDSYLPNVVAHDEELEIESWMIEDGNTDSSELDSELVIEPWMSDSAYLTEFNSEPELEIESWMMK